MGPGCHPSHPRCQRDVVTCSASEVLREGTGICFAKSHLLAALLRAVGIPAGLCYQVYQRSLMVGLFREGSFSSSTTIGRSSTVAAWSSSTSTPMDRGTNTLAMG